MPLIYSGQEAGLNKALRFFDKDTIEWKKSSLRDLYTKLVELKLSNKALRNGLSGGDIERIETNKDDKIFSFLREKENNKVFAVFNLSPEDQKIEISNDIISGGYKDFLDDKEILLTSEYSIELPAWGYKVYTK